MKVLKTTARCPRCGRALISTGRIRDAIRTLYEYHHVDPRVPIHLEVIWTRDIKLYEFGVYDRLYKEIMEDKDDKR